ncbi:MAG: magnesium transporter [Deinococcota bacterium]|jgi:magnesium transporter|nr:magnesium transporter [Deinococcota bacterium]
MPEYTTTLPRDIQRLIEEGRWKQLAADHLDWPDVETVAPELVDTLLSLNKPDRVLLFRALPRRIATEVLASLEGETRDALLLELTDKEAKRLLEDLNPDDRTYLLGELPGQVTQRMLNLLSPEDLAEARLLLGYPEDSVGRLMTPDYLAIKPDWTVSRALEHIRKRGHESETANVIYVVDKDWRLIDDMPLRRLVLADPDARIEDIMDDTFVSLQATDDREEAVRRMRRYDRVALPVVDTTGVLIGIVTVDDVFDVAEEEATEDFHRVGGVVPLRSSYWEAGLSVLYRSRIVWLAALVLVNLVSSGIIAAYEEALEALVALAFFIPLIIDTGGNAGSQSATMMIRAISTGDVKLHQWTRVLLKEAGIGLAIGVTLGAMGFILGLIRGGAEIGMQLGSIVLLTMVIMLVLTNLIGMILPFILTKLKLDPAVASGPLITSIADAVGLIVYFSIATAILGIGAG